MNSVKKEALSLAVMILWSNRESLVRDFFKRKLAMNENSLICAHQKFLKNG